MLLAALLIVFQTAGATSFGFDEGATGDTLATVQGYRYDVVDTAPATPPVSLGAVTCSGTTAPYQCIGQAALSDGRHTVALRATEVATGLASGLSNPLTLQCAGGVCNLAAVATPQNFRKR